MHIPQPRIRRPRPTPSLDEQHAVIRNGHDDIAPYVYGRYANKAEATSAAVKFAKGFAQISPELSLAHTFTVMTVVEAEAKGFFIPSVEHSDDPDENLDELVLDDDVKLTIVLHNGPTSEQAEAFLGELSAWMADWSATSNITWSVFRGSEFN